VSAIPEAKQAAFLAAFRETASITKAAAAARIDRSMHYRWMAEDPEYPPQFEQAKEEAAQSLEDEAIRRAHEGIQHQVIYHGRPCYEPVRDNNDAPVKVPVLDETGSPVIDEEGGEKMRELLQPVMVREYSDTLLIALLKAFRPGKYARQELTGPNGAPIQTSLTVTFVDGSGS
jgi:hypothetical protein